MKTLRSIPEFTGEEPVGRRETKRAGERERMEGKGWSRLDTRPSNFQPRVRRRFANPTPVEGKCGCRGCKLFMNS